MAKILVYSEEAAVVRELLGKAQQVAGEGKQLAAVLFGAAAADAAAWGEMGAQVVYTVAAPVLDTYNPENLHRCPGRRHPAGAAGPGAGRGHQRGLEVYGRAAERLAAGAVSWCVDFAFDPDGQSVTLECLIYTGMGHNTYRISTRPALGGSPAGRLSPASRPRRHTKVIAAEVTINPARLRVLENSEKGAAGRRLQDAPVIVDVGQGVRSRGPHAGGRAGRPAERAGRLLAAHLVRA